MGEGRMLCPECGLEQPEVNTFCPACGVEIRKCLRGGQEGAGGQSRPGPEETEARPPDSGRGPEGHNHAHINALFGGAWRIYRERFPDFLLLFFLTLLPLLVIAGITAALVFAAGLDSWPNEGSFPLGGAMLVAPGALVGAFVYTLSFWTLLILVSDSGLTLSGAVRKALKSLFSYLWVSILFAAAVTAGFVFFIIPGIVFLVWFAFSVFVVAGGEAKGLAALLESRRQVKGRWWMVFWRLLAVWAVSFFFGLIPLLGSVLSLLFTPFMAAYVYVLYVELKRSREMAGKAGQDVFPGEAAQAGAGRGKWIFLVAAGLLILALLAAAGIKKAGKDFYFFAPHGRFQEENHPEDSRPL